MNNINIGIVGLGANTRLRHVPGLRACQYVTLHGVCNRTPESTSAVAAEFKIPKRYDNWQALVHDNEIDAVVIGTWPYLHRDITVAALDAGKHVLCEARMSRDLAEAHQMNAAFQRNHQLIAQIVPSPFGLQIHQTVLRMLKAGHLGELRDIIVLGTNSSTARAETEMHWRQDLNLNGLNKLAMGILHETLVRWTPDPTDVFATARTFTKQRFDPNLGRSTDVRSPDSLNILTTLPNGASATYHLNSATYHGPAPQIQLYGSQGTLHCLFGPEDKLLAANATDSVLQPIAIPPEEQGDWRVEEEFINAIRGKERVQFTDFSTGVRYMAFAQAVETSIVTAQPCKVILD